MQVQKHDTNDDDNDEVNDEVIDDEVGDDEVGDDEVDEYEVDVEEDNVVDDDDDNVVDDVKEDEVHDTSKMIPPSPDMKPKPPTNDDVLQYKSCKLQLKEKNLLVTWHESLLCCGVTGMIVN